MSGGGKFQPETGRRWRWGGLVLTAGLVLMLAGCTAVLPRREAPRPGRTTFSTKEVVLPARKIGNFLIIEANADRQGTRRFLIDTGSSVTLVRPGLARRLEERAGVRVRSADGGVVELARGSLRRLELGGVRFDDVEVLLHDCEALSAHLGVAIDGVLGFPLFREVLLTLDYPGSRVVLKRAGEAVTPAAGGVLALDDAGRMPLVGLSHEGRTITALIDSGSDADFSLNPVGLEPRFVHGPIEGATVGTLTGDRRQRVGRLEGVLALGADRFRAPVVELTDELSAVGGGALRHFAVTFDQVGDRVIFSREAAGEIETPPLRSVGLSFSKTPAYWRVAGVVPGSPAEAAGMARGDLVAKIEGEPVAKWDLLRFSRLVTGAETIGFTLLDGNAWVEKRVRVFELVP